MNARRLILAVLAPLAGCASTAPPTLDATGTVACVAVSSFTVQTTTVYIHADKAGTTSVRPDCAVDLVVLPDAPVAEPAKVTP